MNFKNVLLAFFLVGCGQQEAGKHLAPPQTETEKYRDQVLALQDQINSVIQSDFATCAVAGTETSNLIIRNICNIAKAATEEQRVKSKGELIVMYNYLKDRLDSADLSMLDLQNLYASVGNRVDALEVQISTGLTTIDIGFNTTLIGYGPFFETVLRQQDRSKINAFVTSTTNIPVGSNPLQNYGNSTVTATVATDEINLTGHLFRVNAPVKFTTSGTLPAPLSTATTYYVISITANAFVVSTAVGGSAVNITTVGTGTHKVTSSQIVVTTTGAHGLSAGNTVYLNAFLGVSGISSGNLSGDFEVMSVPSTTTFTVHMNISTFPTATNTAFGGANGIVQQVLGRGMSTAWTTATGEALATAAASRTYTFLILDNTSVVAVAPVPAPTWFVTNAANAANSGTICWSKISASANAATIKAGGANISCY